MLFLTLFCSLVRIRSDRLPSGSIFIFRYFRVSLFRLLSGVSDYKLALRAQPALCHRRRPEEDRHKTLRQHGGFCERPRSDEVHGRQVAVPSLAWETAVGLVTKFSYC